jgi:hypothetical protein
MLCARRSLSTLHLLDNATATQDVASVGRLLLHAPVHFLGFEDLLAIGKSNTHAFADRSLVFSLQGENVGQKRFYTRIAASLFAPISICLPPASPSTFLSRCWFPRTLREKSGYRTTAPSI